MPDNFSADTLFNSGSAVAPASGATIATVAIPQSTPVPGITPAETYEVVVTTYQTGTVDTGHEANLVLTHGATTVGVLQSGPNPVTLILRRINPGADTDLSIKTNAAYAAASVVNATIAATRLS